MTDERDAVCDGCGLRLPPCAGPRHPYIGASPACWALFETVLAREYSDPARFTVHAITVDAYAVQHPGRPGRREARSVNLHLLRLCLTLERELEARFARQAMAAAARTLGEPRWLIPPTPAATFTVAHVACASDAEDHVRRSREWAAEVWRSWSAHHAPIRDLADTTLALMR